MLFTVYATNGGKISRFIDFPGTFEEIPQRAGEEMIEGIFEGCSHVIDGQPVTIPPPPPTDAELLAAIRTRRNQLLSACDWTQLPDVALTGGQKTAWAAYRQALRDFPEHCDPAAPVWPTPPA